MLEASPTRSTWMAVLIVLLAPLGLEQCEDCLETVLDVEFDFINLSDRTATGLIVEFTIPVVLEDPGRWDTQEGSGTDQLTFTGGEVPPGDTSSIVVRPERGETEPDVERWCFSFGNEEPTLDCESGHGERADRSSSMRPRSSGAR